MTQAAASSAAPFGWPALSRHRAVVMGVLNLTPNSFSDGGAYGDVAAGVARAGEIEAEGAAIVDIGGESTHPSAPPTSGEEERARVLPALAEIVRRIAIPVSIDTYKAATAEAALKAGARIVNDVWGLQRDPDMARVIAAHGAGVCIMHNRVGADASIDILADMRAFFARSLEIAQQAGIDRRAIVLDPGIGFGKTFEQNLICLHHLETLHDFGLPLLVGCSRKGFIGAATGVKDPARRLTGSVAAHVAAALKGAAIIRAHDVAPHCEALAVAGAIVLQSFSRQGEAA